MTSDFDVDYEVNFVKCSWHEVYFVEAKMVEADYGSAEVQSTPQRGSRLQSRLEAQGAEFLVLAHMLIENIETYKSYVNHPGYDLVAVNSAAGRSARISVKSRWATNKAGTFVLDNLDCDFVVHVALNRGERRKRQTISTVVSTPQLYIFPVQLCAAVRSPWGRVTTNKIGDVREYEQNWSPLKAFLEIST